MWKPAERIKFTTSESNWPNKEQASKSRLFSPVKIGGTTLVQRTWIPAMVPWRSNEQGEVTQDVLDWYERFALGKPGAIVVEATGIRDIPSGPLLRIGHDRYIEGLKKLVDCIQQASEGKTKTFIQIIDFLNIRRRPDKTKFLQQYLDIQPSYYEQCNISNRDESALRQHLLTLDDDTLHALIGGKEWENLQYGYRERVTDTHLEHIQTLPDVLPDLFAQSALRAKQAGFDGVELHYAHAYTMASFLSATNTREDGYGGNKEQRIRLPLEVFRAAREAVGDEYTLGCRFLSDEIIDNGNRLDDACYFAEQFAKAGMDFLSLSRGGKFDDAKQPKAGWAAYPYTGPSGYECMPSYISDQQGPFGRNIAPVDRIRQHIRKLGYDIPCIVAGGIYNFEQAEQVLEHNQADVIGLARQALADPDWFEKVKTGHGEQVALCRYSNYCEALDQKHKQVTCEVWDRNNLDEPNISKTSDGRRRMTAPLWEKQT